ncbi:MAG: class I tRNA ligase family protein, partial [Cyclobacteriaceae bacterium]|nr:class I tRNA ligase family protein [Cyclobacteriaceae bacterium]
LEQSKPWDTHGIDGTFRFLKKLWNLFHDANGNLNISEEAPTEQEYKVLHTAIKKTQEDIDRLSFNTIVSAFMICVNELSALKCNKREILSDLVILVSPFSPHITEELWHMLSNEGSVVNATFPTLKEEYLKEDSFEYPVSVNGKLRVKLTFPINMAKEEIEKQVLENETVKKWTNGNPPKKVIVVPNKIVNVVV